jgi:two-component system, OmpR family, sensor histidine kinase TorS
MVRRWGIGTRLFLAFVVIAMLGLTSGLVGWLSLRHVAESQEIVTERAFPAVVTAQSVARVSAEMVSAIPELASATTPEQHEARAQALRMRAHTLERLLESLDRQPPDAAAIDDLRDNASALIDNLSRQERLVAHRIRDSVRTEAWIAHAVEEVTALSDVAADLVANASARSMAVIANLYGLVELPLDEHEPTFLALDRLVEEDLYLLERMFELRLRSAQVAMLLNQLERAPSVAATEEIEEVVLGHVNVIDRRIDSIDDPVRRERARSHFLELTQWDEGAELPSLFELRRDVIETRQAVSTLSEENRTLAGTLDTSVSMLVESARRFSADAADEAKRSTQYGLWTVIGVSLVAILIATLVVWLYVERNIARRLQELSTAMLGLAGGNLDLRISRRGDDELAEMARAVHVFRDDALRRRRLERERDAAEAELREHREQLQELVNRQTAELRQTNERLRHEVIEHDRARTEAEQANRAKSEFMAMVSHEIRTPMSGVLGLLRIMRDGDEPPAEQRQSLARAESSAQTLLSILNGILDYSRADAGRIGIEAQDFDCCELLESLVTTLQPTAAEKGLKLDYRCTSSLSGLFHGDAGKVRQVLFNLVGNALKFTHSGRVMVDVECGGNEEGGDGDTIWLQFSVRDTGIGMAPEDLEVIFEPFRQARGTAVSCEHGAGLGLAIARRLVEAMGGRIEARSEPGRGSTFEFRLPVTRTSAGDDADATEGSPREAVRTLAVLVVEDNEVHRIVAGTMLERMGHRVVTVTRGEEAVEVFERQSFDVVLLDMHLPGIDGIETARRLRAAIPEARIPIVAMSAHVFRSEIDAYRDAGMDAVIIKPVWPETLDRALHQAFSEAPVAVIGDHPDDRAETDTADEGADLDPELLAAEIEELGARVVVEMIRQFRELAPRRLEELACAGAAEDRDSARRRAHELKSSASCLGLQALAYRCTVLEREAPRAEGECLQELASRAIAAHNRALERLAEYEARLLKDVDHGSA